jgi:hypothetical protein
VAGAAFQVVDVTDWPVDEFESAGQDEKLWLREPATGSTWLYKPVTRHEDWQSRRLDPEQGEDWAEKIASELARLIGLPAAFVELAERHGVRGCISLNLRPRGWELQPGTVLLSEIVPNYDPTPGGGHVGHTLQNVQRVLEGYTAPLGWPTVPNGLTAFDVFAGYLVLDAWIANRDRHSENWAVLRSATEPARSCLCPSYDHASSLGYHLTRSKMGEIIRERGVTWWATRKDTAYRYADGKDVRLVDFAHRALHLASSGARQHWLNRVGEVQSSAWEGVVGAVPGMSDAAVTFVLELLEANRRRLVDA